MHLDHGQKETLEAFADTIIPGEKRTLDDRAVAGVASGGGAVAAGALDLLQTEAGGLAEILGVLADLLNKHAETYSSEHRLDAAADAPAFVALAYEHRTALVQQLCTPGHPEKQMWVNVAVFSNMAFDSAAHMSTADALAAGHPGLTTIGFSKPDADGLWRFPEYSYGRALAPIHPATTPMGSPA